MSIFVLSGDNGVSLATNSAIIKAADRSAADAAIKALQDIDHEKQTLLAKAQDQASRAKDQGYKEGFAEGQKAAANEGTAALVDMAQKLEKARQKANQDARDLALEMVKHVLGNFKSEEITAAIAAEAVRKLDEPSPLVVLVAPENVDATKKQLDKLGYTCNIEGDEVLGPLDCQVSNEFGDIHAGLESQLEVLRDLVQGEGHTE